MNGEIDGETWKVLDQAITPAEAVQKFQERGINLSERTLREFARRVGAYRIIGKAMFLMPSDVDAILEASRPQPSTPGAALTSQNFKKIRPGKRAAQPPASDLNKVRARLQDLKRNRTK